MPFLESLVGPFFRVLGPLATYFNQPKLYIEFFDRGYSLIPINGNSATLICKSEFKITNNSDYDAYNLLLMLPTGVFQRMTKLDKYNNLEKRKQIVLEAENETILENEINQGVRFGTISYHSVVGTDTFSVTLQYENQKGVKFYALFKNTNRVGSSELFVRNPSKKE